MAPLIRDPWHYQLTEFASIVIGLFGAVSAQRLYSPRRTGKTSFVKLDLWPAAVNAGYHPIYIDLWENTEDAAQTLAEGFRRAVEGLAVPDSRTGRTLQQPVRGVRALGFGIDMAEQLQRSPPDESLLQIRFWLDELVRQVDRPVLAIFDEVQQIALDRRAHAVSAALRAAVQAHSQSVKLFFTGSSQDQLARMFSDANAPFYQYGQALDLPILGSDFVNHIADQFEATATQLRLDRDKLSMAFETLDRKPGPFREMINAMLYARSTDIESHLHSQIDQETWRARDLIENKGLSRLELIVAARVAHGLSTTGRKARTVYREILGRNGNDVHIAEAQRALRRLRETGLIYKTEQHGDYRVVSAPIANELREQAPLDRIKDR